MGYIPKGDQGHLRSIQAIANTIGFSSQIDGKALLMTTPTQIAEHWLRNWACAYLQTPFL